MAIFGLDIRYYVGGAEEPLALQGMTAAFERAGAEMQDVGKHIFPKLIPVLEKAVGAQLAAEGHGPNAGPYKPLSPAYARRKQKVYPGKPILEASGRMKRALTDGGSGSALRYYSGTELRFGTAGVTYASFHQTGTDRKRGAIGSAVRAAKRALGFAQGKDGMPARPIFDFDAEAVADINGAALEGAREAIRASRLDHYATIAGDGTP